MPCRRGQLWTVSCQHFQQPGVGPGPERGSWVRHQQCPLHCPTIKSTFWIAKKEKGAFSSSLRTCPRRDEFYFCAHISFTSSHTATTSCKGNCRVCSILWMAIRPAIDQRFNYWNIGWQLAVHSPSCQFDPQCSSPWQSVCPCLWLPASLGILPTELVPALRTSMLRSDHCFISPYWEHFYTHNW